MRKNAFVLRIFILLVSVLLCVSCKKSKEPTPEERGSIFQDSKMSGPSDQRYGSQGQITIKDGKKSGALVPDDNGKDSHDTGGKGRAYKNCRKAVPVTKGDLTTPEGTLYFVFKALLEKDESVAFRKFLSFVDTRFQREGHVKRYWFASARKDNSKNFLRLVYGRDDPSYVICSKRPEGKDGLRIFIGKSPPVGSNPPMVLNKVGNKWLLKNFAPH